MGWAPRPVCPGGSAEGADGEACGSWVSDPHGENPVVRPMCSPVSQTLFVGIYPEGERVGHTGCKDVGK